MTLAVGAISEQVTVTANTTLVETKNTGVGQVIDNQRVMELPLNGRQATELIFLSGLATSAPAGDLNTNKNFPTVTISVAGGQANGITYIMDGGTHNDPFNNLNLPTPFPDALQEFKVETSALPARYGHHAASAVNLVTKSGIEPDPRRRVRVPPQLPLQRAQLLRAGARQPEPQSVRRHARRADHQEQAVLLRRLSGPHREEQPGDDDQLRADAGDAERRLHRRSRRRRATAAASVNLTGGFVNNRIDPSRLSPVALNFLKHVPVSTDPCGTAAVRHPEQQHRAPGRSARSTTRSTRTQSLFARYFYAVYDNPATYDGSNVLTLSRTGQNNQAHSLVVGHNLVLSSSTLNSLHVTFNRTLNDRPLPPYFSADRSRPQRLQPGAGLRRRQRHRQRLRGRHRRAPTRATSTPKGWQIADDLDLIRGDAPVLGRRQLDSLAHRDAEQPADQRRVHVQRPGHRPLARRLHARHRQRRVPPGQPGLRLRPQRLRRRLRAGQLARRVRT